MDDFEKVVEWSSFIAGQLALRYL